MAVTCWETTLHRLFLVCITSLVVAMTMAGPVRHHKDKILSCYKQCRVPKERRFKYESDHTYDYSYKVEVTTQLTSRSHLSVRMLIEAVASVHVLDSCDMMLKLREVSIMESDPEGQLRKSDNSRHFQEELEKVALRFAFQDGRVSDVCPSNTEATWALNVKRGFLSAFQNGMEDMKRDQSVDETDVLGTCRTVYNTFGAGWFSNTIKRSRDLADCSSNSSRSSKQDSASFLPHQGQSESAFLRSFLSGRQDCEQTIDWHGILSRAICVEQRHFRPLAGETTGFTTKISLTITMLQKRERGDFAQPVYKRRSLEYDSMPIPTDDNSMNNEAAEEQTRATLKQLCEPTEVLPETPDLFYELVGNIRQLAGSSLRELYEQLHGKSLCLDDILVKKLFLDALAMAGTEPALRQLVNVLTSRDQETIGAHFLLSTFHFLPSVTSSMLEAVRPLLDNVYTSEKAFLPVSSLVHRYCQTLQQENGQCDKDANVQRLLVYFRRAIGVQCYATGGNSKQVQLGLRAIGNAGQGERMTDVLNACLMRKNNPVDIRISAVQAYRRMPCTVTREKAQQIFEDASELTELRIASYLTMMQCATTSSHFLKLQSSLAAETNTQVLSFVFTHLSKVKETGNAGIREQAERVLSSVDFASKDLGRLQLSRYLAGSAWSDRMKVVSTIIWPLEDPTSSSSSSSSSFWLPRSVSTNLTFNLMDKAFDFAEVEVSSEGLDVMVADVLMPMMGLKESFLGPKKRQEKLDRLRASMYVRIFGNELFHYQLTGTGNILQQLTSGKALNLNALLSKLAADGQTSYSQSLVLLDHQLTVPTSSGLPLTLTINGSVSALLHVAGSLDLRRAFSMAGTVKPSAALRVCTAMTVDAGVTRVAVRLSGSLHTSAILKGRVHIERGRMADVALDLPMNEMTVFDARTEMSFLFGKTVHALTLTPEERHGLELCTGPTGVRLTGLDICGKVQVPKSMEYSCLDVLSHPSTVNLMVYKRDSLTQYRFFAQHLLTENSLTTQLNFSTPGSDLDRTFDFSIDGSTKKKKVDLRMITPWKKLELTGFITNTPTKKEAQLSLSVDHQIKNSLRAGLTVTKDTIGITFRPLLEIHDVGWGSSEPLGFVGLLHLGHFGRKVSTEVEVRGLPGMTPSFKGSLTNSPKERSLKAMVILKPSDTYSISLGTFVSARQKVAKNVEVTPFFFLNSHSKQLVSFTGRGDYRMGRSLQADVKLSTIWTRPISLKYTMSKAVTAIQTHYRCEAELKSSAGWVSVDVRADLKHLQMVWTRLVIAHDLPSFSPRDTVSMMTKLVVRSKDNYRGVFVHSSLQSKSHSQHNFESTLNAEMQRTDSRMKFFCSYGDGPSQHVVSLTAKMRHDFRSFGHVNVAGLARAEISSEGLDVQVKVSHSHSSQGLDSKIAMDYGEGQQFKAQLTLINKSKAQLVVMGSAILVLPRGTLEKVLQSKRTKLPSNKVPADFYLKWKVIEGVNDYEVTTGVKTLQKKRRLSVNMTVMKPVSLRRVQIHCRTSPHSTFFQDFEAEFSHTMHPLLADVIELVFAKEWSELDLAKPFRLLTTLGAAKTLQEDLEVKEADPNIVSSELSYDTAIVDAMYAELLSMEQSEGYDNILKTNIKGGVDVKSTFVDLISGSWNFAHTYEGPWHKTDVSLDLNGKRYACEMSVRDNVAKWLEHSMGKIAVSTPVKKVTADWSHEHDTSRFRSTFSTSWNKWQQIAFSVSSHVSAGNQSETVHGDFLMKLPWRPVEDLRVSVSHDARPGHLRSKCIMRLNDVIRASHELMLAHTSTFTDAGMLLVTPWTRKLTGSMLVQHGFYPMTTTVELDWSSRHHLSLTGTADLKVWDDAQVSLNVTTTVSDLKKVSLEVSNRMLGENLVSEMKGQCGNHYAVSVENVVRRHDWTQLKLRILTPFEMFRVLETGYTTEGSLRNFSAHADFRTYPLIRKIESSLVWVYDTNFSGKFRLDTPLEDFPFLQIVTTSKTKDAYRYSSVIVKYHPSQVYAVNSKHTIASLEDIVLSINTPHRSFDSVSLEFHQKNTRPVKDVSMKIVLPHEQEINLYGHVTMENQGRGSFILYTPFSGFETYEAVFVYSFLGADLSVAGNLTTENGSVLSHFVLLYENTTDMLTQPSGSTVHFLEGLLQMKNSLRPLRKLDFGLQTAAASHLSEKTNGDLKLLVLYDQQAQRLYKTFQFDLSLAQTAMAFSNFTQDNRETYVSFAAGYGKDYLVSGNASILQVDSDSASNNSFSNESPELSDSSILPGENQAAHISVCPILHNLDVVSLNLQLQASSLQYDRFGFKADFQRSLQHANRSADLPENPDENTPASAPALQTRIVGRLQVSGHTAFVNIKENRSGLFEISVEIMKGLSKADNVSVLFHIGIPLGISAGIQLAMNDRQVFSTSLKQVYDQQELYSARSWNNGHSDTITLVLLGSRCEDMLSVNISALWNGTVDASCRYTERYEDEDRRHISVEFGLNSVDEGIITSSTNVTFSGSEPLANLGITTNSTVPNKYVNMSFEMSKQGSLRLSGRIAEPVQTKDLPQEVLEIVIAYREGPRGFTSSIFLNSSSLGSPVIVRVEAMYASVYDMDYALIFKTPLPFVTHLHADFKSDSKDENNSNASLSFGWEQYKKITVIVSRKRVFGMLDDRRHIDVQIVTPLQGFQNVQVTAIHNKTQSKIDRALSARVNTELVLDLSISSTDLSAVGIPPGLIVLFQNSAPVLEKPSYHMNMFIHWNLTNPSSKMHVFSRYDTSDEGDNVQFKHVSVKVTHPWKTLNTKYLSTKSSDETAGEGELTWNDSPAEDKKIVYRYSFSNKTTLSARAYHVLFTLGTPFRSVVTNGSWTGRNSVQVGSDTVGGLGFHTVQGVIYWDADRDPQKQLILNASVTPGDVTSADIAVTIPVLSQTFRLRSDLALGTRNAVWNSTTSISFSPDPAKTLTLTSVLLHTSGPDDAEKFTFTTFLAQPSSSVDLGVYCTAFSSGSQVSGSVAGWFLTTEGQVEKVLLSGDCNSLRSSADVVLGTPIRNVSVTAELSRNQPYELRVLGRTADAQEPEKRRTLGFHVSLDSLHRSVFVKVHHEADSAHNYIAAEAWFVNHTAIRAEVYHPHMTGRMTDIALSTHLDPSHSLLHVNLLWRPQLSQDIQALSDRAVSLLNEFHVQATEDLKKASLTTYNQLVKKWVVASTQIAEDLQAAVDLLLSEMASVQDQLNEHVLRNIEDFARLSQDFPENGADLLDDFRNVAGTGIVYTRTVQTYRRVAELSDHWLDSVRQSQMAYLYFDVVNQLHLTSAVVKKLGEEQLEEVVRHIEMYLAFANERLQEFTNALYSLEHWYMDEVTGMCNVVPSVFGMKNGIDMCAEPWLAPRYNASYDLLKRKASKLFKGFWRCYEPNLDLLLQNSVDSLAHTLWDVIIAEARFHARHFLFLRESRFTLWDPSQGKILAEVHLPFPVKYLGTWPEMPTNWTPLQSDLKKHKHL